jgi:nicotinate-nucleotide pyrophosphorylase (carboxylating)
MEILTPELDSLILKALHEDIGAGDVTTDLLITPETQAASEIIFKEEGILAGLGVAQRVFELLNYGGNFKALTDDGAGVKPGQPVALIHGSAAKLLQGERVALNFLQHLSGIATLTRRAVNLLKHSKIKILDTRKTLPGLRFLEKYAVKIGQGNNHRLGLYDGILIKNNHLKFFASLKDAVIQAKIHAPLHLKVEVETRTLKDVSQALEAGADIIMLDNMSLPEIVKALAIIKGRAKVELSGKINLEKITDLTKLKVDFISMGMLTHSAPALDISLSITPV